MNDPDVHPRDAAHHPEFAPKLAEFKSAAAAGKLPQWMTGLLTPDDVATLESLGAEVLQRLGPVLVKLVVSRFGHPAGAIDRPGMG